MQFKRHFLDLQMARDFQRPEYLVAPLFRQMREGSWVMRSMLS